MSVAAESRQLLVDVVDRDGAPVQQAVIYVEALDDRGRPPTTGHAQAVMDQLDRQFVPHILVVESGTEITFPNSDTVSHHVYSFSPAKRFELALYKQGTVHAPLMFDTPGVVTLGCNIHDDMIGYILVVDTPHFTVTDASGTGALDDLPSGRYQVHVWTPRLRPADLPMPTEIEVAAGATMRFSSRITAKLLPGHDTGTASLTWTKY